MENQPHAISCQQPTDDYCSSVMMASMRTSKRTQPLGSLTNSMQTRQPLIVMGGKPIEADQSQTTMLTNQSVGFDQVITYESKKRQTKKENYRPHADSAILLHPDQVVSGTECGVTKPYFQEIEPSNAVLYSNSPLASGVASKSSPEFAKGQFAESTLTLVARTVQVRKRGKMLQQFCTGGGSSQVSTRREPPCIMGTSSREPAPKPRVNSTAEIASLETASLNLLSIPMTERDALGRYQRSLVTSLKKLAARPAKKRTASRKGKSMSCQMTKKKIVNPGLTSGKINHELGASQPLKKNQRQRKAQFLRPTAPSTSSALQTNPFTREWASSTSRSLSRKKRSLVQKSSVTQFINQKLCEIDTRGLPYDPRADSQPKLTESIGSGLLMETPVQPRKSARKLSKRRYDGQYTTQPSAIINLDYDKSCDFILDSQTTETKVLEANLRTPEIISRPNQPQSLHFQTMGSQNINSSISSPKALKIMKQQSAPVEAVPGYTSRHRKKQMFKSFLTIKSSMEPQFVRRLSHSSSCSRRHNSRTPQKKSTKRPKFEDTLRQSSDNDLIQIRHKWI